MVFTKLSVISQLMIVIKNIKCLFQMNKNNNYTRTISKEINLTRFK